jgi:3-hydroxyanthranilate 3,4-dioxygenase
MAAPLIPTNIWSWVEENRNVFDGPVANKVIFENSEFIFMMIKGPNRRNDFHVDPGDEIFIQLKGDIQVDLMMDGKRETRIVQEGEMFFIPKFVPHCPMRPADSWGFVVERQRRSDEPDGVEWYCENCGHLLARASFHVSNIEVELREALETFNADVARRTCTKCHAVLPDPGFFTFDRPTV